MNDVAIRVEGLGKSYLIGHQAERERYTALRDVLATAARRLAGKVFDRLAKRPNTSNSSIEEFWALNDLNFEVRHGEVVGIIGRNGAGKSTLLKILSQITEPTRGRVTINGRISSLLEVGTGFHPELTGRENIFLNGAILGMRRAEILRKFDEIVDFSGVEKFLDTPVKRYSSGMYVRLAFAVAAHLEPDILVVDEVLAVGDADFQKKCLSKMQDVSTRGRTILFVSHNLSAVQSLCTTALLLNDGRLLSRGTVSDVMSAYASKSTIGRRTRGPTSPSNVQVVEVDCELIVQRHPPNRRLRVSLDLSAVEVVDVNIDIRIADLYGTPIAYASLGNAGLFTPIRLHEGENKVELEVDVSQLVVGRYIISIDLTKPFSHYFDRFNEALSFDIESHHWFEAIQPTRQEWALGCVQLPIRQT